MREGLRTPRGLAIGGAILLALGALGALLDVRAALAAYLAAWWFWIGVSLGAAANVWLHDLTGGGWGVPIRAPLTCAARQLPWLALLFLPLLAGAAILYPWAGAVANSEQVAAKAWWLNLPFFVARSVVYLALWAGLGLLARRPVFASTRHRAAAGLIAYGFTVTLASVDWLMSLLPQWYSTGFGLIVGIGQMLAGFAFAVVIAARRANAAPAVLRDLGNLLLMYVMTWAYLAFTHFLIIWAEDIPAEIAWYLPRSSGPWLGVAWILVVFQFFAPLVILLFRGAKEAARLLGALALALLAVHALDVAWLILPSAGLRSAHALWMTPLLLLGLGGVWLALWMRDADRVGPVPVEEARHA